MSDNFLFVQNQPSTLAGAGTSIGDTTVILSSFTQIDGTLLTMADFGSIGFGTIEPGNGIQEEQISFSGVTQNSNGTGTLTGVKSVLNVSPYTQSTGLATSHAGGTQFVVSNTAGFYDKLTAKSDDETITGLWQFPNDSNTPILGTSYVAPTLQYQVASKGYVDAIAIAGAPNATTSVQGLVQLPTQAQVDAKTSTGSTGASLVVTPNLVRSTQLSDYVADTGGTNSFTITPTPSISAYVTGQTFSFKANHANTGAATLAVSGLGTIAVKKLGSTTALVANDVLASQIVEVEYDGSVFQMKTPSGKDFVDLVTNQSIGGQKSFTGTANQFTNLPQSSAVPSTGNDLVNKTYTDALTYLTPQSGLTTKNANDASATQTIAHGLGRTPRYVKLSAYSMHTNTTPWDVFWANSVYNGSTQSSMTYRWLTTNTTTTAITAGTFVISTGSNSLGTSGAITFDSSNISVAWVKADNNSTGTYNILWEAF